MSFVCFLTALLACVIGKICGMGGGVIIKPVLDAFGAMSVASINFLSSCTVTGMSCWSVGKSAMRGKNEIDWKVSTPLALGAALGGLAGKEAFSLVAQCFSNADMAGGVQAVILFAATLATLLYTVCKDRIGTYRVCRWIPCFLIGLALGMLGAFLGIGGGPFNMAALYFFFSMSTKTAAQNSLYVILISQLAGLSKTVFFGSAPELEPYLLVGMIACGVVGSEIGGRINTRLNEKSATVLFEFSMVLILCINVYNIINFFFLR